MSHVRQRSPEKPKGYPASYGRWRGSLLFTLFGTYVLPAPRLVWSGGLVNALEEFGFSTAASRIALSRLARRGFLESSKDGRRVFFAMTPTLVALLKEGEDRIFSFGRQQLVSKQWTLLSYSIPEALRAERDRLRKRLAFLGFAPLYDGFWFSPRDRVEAARAAVAELGLQQYADIFVGMPANPADGPELISRAWKGQKLNRMYEGFVAEFGPHRSSNVLQRLSDRDAFLMRTRVVHEFRRFPQIDPEFPDPGVQERRRQAVEMFDVIYGSLSELSQLYFDRVTTPVSTRQRT